MLSFGVYNALIGYLLLHLEKQTVPALIFVAIAMALHFVVTDFGLNEDHKEQYRSTGCWILVVAVFAGLATGAVTALSDIAIAVLVAFFAGGVRFCRRPIDNNRYAAFQRECSARTPM